MKSSFVNMGLCACVFLCFSNIKCFSESQSKSSGGRQNGKDSETSQKPGATRAFPEGLGSRRQGENRLAPSASARDGLWWVEHSWLSAEVWAALKSTLAALGGGQRGLYLVGEAQGRTGLLRGLEGARI